MRDALSGEHGITEAGAKEMTKTAFTAREGRELYDAGQEAEALHHKQGRRQVDETEEKPENRPRRQRSRARS